MIILTIEKLKAMGDSEIFAKGEGIFKHLYSSPIRWVAVSGNGYYDWAIYYDTINKTDSQVSRTGLKLFEESLICFFVPCDAEAFKMYRNL